MEFSRKRRIRNVQQVSDIYESEDNVFFTLPCSYVGVLRRQGRIGSEKRAGTGSAMVFVTPTDDDLWSWRVSGEDEVEPKRWNL